MIKKLKIEILIKQENIIINHIIFYFILFLVINVFFNSVVLLIWFVFDIIVYKKFICASTLKYVKIKSKRKYLV